MPQDKSFNLTANLVEVASDGQRLRALQAALQAHAADVLYELPDSRVADHFLRQAHLAVTKVCDRSISLNTAPGISWERSAGRE